MKIRHRLVFNKKRISIDFVNFLKERNAVFSYVGSDLVPDLTVVYIYEKDEWKNDLYYFMQAEKITSIVDSIYTKEEFEQAEWLSIRPKFRFEYPQPEDCFEYKNLTYDSTKYCSNCGCGLKQKEEFKINKSPKWGKRNFLMLNWVEDELFISNAAKEIIEDTAIKGYKMFDVINYKKSNPIDDICQIYVEEILKPGLTNEQQSIKEVIKCKKCGATKYIYTGRGLTYKKEIFEGLKSDIAKSTETFGAGHMCARIIFISKEFYKIIKSNKLDKDLIFEPVSLV